jgi:hypothetical protein
MFWFFFPGNTLIGAIVMVLTLVAIGGSEPHKSRHSKQLPVRLYYKITLL